MDSPVCGAYLALLEQKSRQVSYKYSFGGLSGPGLRRQSLNGKRALLDWCRQKLADYKDVKVRNLTTSWRDGLAFCALIHHFRPDLIDFKSLSKGDIAKNNQLAFQIAEEELGIPSLLDVSDLIEMEEPEELSMMTYISMFYKHFKNQTPPNKKKEEPKALDHKKKYLFDVLCDERFKDYFKGHGMRSAVSCPLL